MARMDELAPGQVRAVREERGWTLDEMADAVHASPLEVAAWEAGTLRPPEKQEAWVRWLIAHDAWHARVIDAGLPQCRWVQAHAPDLHAQDLEQRFLDWHINNASLAHHVESCDACMAVRDFARRTPPNPAPPGDDFDRLSARYERWVSRRPGWMRAPLRLISAIPVLACVALIPDEGAGWPATVAGLAFGGMFAGLVHRVARAKMAGLSAKYPYTAGVLASAFGVGSGLLLWNVYDSALHVTDARVLAGAGLTAVAMGLVSGARVRREQDEAGALDAARTKPLLGARIPVTEPGVPRMDAHGVQRG